MGQWQTAGKVAAALLLVAGCALAGCARDYPEGADPKKKVRGAHAWNRPGYQGPEFFYMRERQDPGTTDTLEVEAPPEKGPAFPTEDTLELDKLNGYWLVVAISHDEKQTLLPVSEQDTFIFQNSRSVIFHAITNWQDTVQEGSIKKLRPGVLGLKFGSAEFDEFYTMMFRDDFMYIWNYKNKTGFWMVRLPDQVTERVEANTFQTSRGTLSLTDVVGSSFIGRVESGPQSMTVNGFYNRGVISIYWEQDDRTGNGFAAFTVGPEWKTLTGAWWIDDYEAIPFSDVWDGTRL
jgi:hypothetical protein